MTRFVEPNVHIKTKDIEDEGVFDLPQPGGANLDDSVLESDFSYIHVTTPGHEIHEGWPKVITTWRNRLLASDWLVKVGLSESHFDEQLHKNGNVKKAEHDVKTYWLNGLKGSQYVTILYDFDAETGDTIRTSRTVRHVERLLGDKEMQAVIKGD
jgi:hypothetical protein